MQAELTTTLPLDTAGYSRWLGANLYPDWLTRAGRSVLMRPPLYTAFAVPSDHGPVEDAPRELRKPMRTHRRQAAGESACPTLPGGFVSIGGPQEPERPIEDEGHTEPRRSAGAIAGAARQSVRHAEDGRLHYLWWAAAPLGHSLTVAARNGAASTYPGIGR